MSTYQLHQTEAISAEQSLRELVMRHDRIALLSWLDGKEPIDIASEADELSDAELGSLIDLLPSSKIAPLMSDSDDELRVRIASQLDDTHLLLIVSGMADDDVADVLSELPPARVGQLLAGMREADRAVISTLLEYPDETAGSIMTTSFLTLQEERTVEEALATIHARGSQVEQLQTSYVIDANGQLAGFVDLRTMLTAPRTVTIASIMSHNVISIDPYADQEEAAGLVARYDLNSLPVVSGGQMLGVITVDDIIDVIIEEYDEDLLHLAGANSEESIDSPLFSSVRMRLPWLLVNLATAFLASFVVATFESTIEQAAALAAIMTIVSGMGGNAGSQTMAIVVRHLSRERITGRETLSALVKEVATGVVDGAAVGMVTGIVVAMMYHNPHLSLIVLAAMVGNMVIAGTAGLLVPVALKACRQDPAVSSSIFVTTATDVLGFLLFLGLAQLFLPLLV